MKNNIDPIQVIEELKAGNQRFLAADSVNTPQSSLGKLKNFAANGQVPKAVVLCCSDSRAPVEIIFDQDIGDLFVIRVAGNIIAPSLVGSVEFAAAAFGTRLVLVMGHTQCGAIDATLTHIKHIEIGSENIHDIVSRIKPHIYHLAHDGNLSPQERREQAVEANVRASVSQLKSASRELEAAVQNGSIKIVGAVLELATGRVKWLEE